MTPLDRGHEAEFRALIDGKAKPLGALGRLETLAIRLALIADSPNPSAKRARLYVFAGDHGLNRAGVSAYPSEVTAAMVATLLAGKATANAFARATDVEVLVVDAGVAADLPAHPHLIACKIAPGTANAAIEAAMTSAQLDEALASGAALAHAAAADGIDVLAIGEMGIGNSASAALILHRLAPAALADAVGHDAEGLARKHAVLAQAAARSLASDPHDVLREFGGFEIAMMAGAILGAAEVRKPIVIDGFIAGAAALAAIRIAPEVADFCIFAHRSAERGHAILLAALDAEPLLDLSMRLGEGTGALLAVPLIRAAAAMIGEVASLDDVLQGRI
jgi:nicotinate-nucleotide--dimethylbenzimidazole phosphoribosyltransferase